MTGVVHESPDLDDGTEHRSVDADPALSVKLFAYDVYRTYQKDFERDVEREMQFHLEHWPQAQWIEENATAPVTFERVKLSTVNARERFGVICRFSVARDAVMYRMVWGGEG